MRIHTCDVSGAILSTLRVANVASANLQIGGDVAGWVEATETSAKETHYVMDVDDEPLLQPRPSVTPFADGTAPLTLDMAALPSGTEVQAINNAGASVATSDPADPVRLTGPGTYTVEIQPPFPHMTSTRLVTVDA